MTYYQPVGLGHIGHMPHPSSAASLVRRRAGEVMWMKNGSQIGTDLEFVRRLGISEDAEPRCPSSRYRIRQTGIECQVPVAAFDERRLALHLFVFSTLPNSSE
jgi:hypothetical protein